MLQYHGTDKTSASGIISSGVKVIKGGGELGRGFYTGNYEWEAFNWNWHKHKDKGSVIKIDIKDDEFWKLNVLFLTIVEGMAFYHSIKKGGFTRSHLYNRDIVGANFFGYAPKSHNAEQLKFESNTAETFINGSHVTRVII